MLNRDIFIEMISAGFIIDGRAGGLVLGRPHKNGNVYTLAERDGEYICPLSMEGGEYLINRDAYDANKKQIDEINTFKEFHETPPIEITNLLRIINTHSEINDKIVFIEYGQFIVNKNATSRYLNELQEINNDKSNKYLYCYIEKILPHAFEELFTNKQKVF